MPDRTHGGDVDHWARQTNVDPDAIVDFSASINPLGPPAAARRAFRESYKAIYRYPDPYGEALKADLAKAHGMNSDEVLLGNGSTQLIYLLCAAVRPLKALVVGPAFSEYANALTFFGARIRNVFLSAADGFEFRAADVIVAWEKGCDTAFLATPNSVTGRLIPKTAIEHLAELARKKRKLLVVDEAFMDFVEEESMKSRVRDNPYLIVLRSLTKFYSLPGLRIGYLLGERERIAQLASRQEPWSVNAPALHIARACLADCGFAMKTARWLGREQKFLSARLGAIEGLRVFGAHANFLLARIDRKGADAVQLQKFLWRNRMLIRACGSFPGLDDRYFRVAVRRRRDNLNLIGAIEEWASLSAG